MRGDWRGGSVCPGTGTQLPFKSWGLPKPRFPLHHLTLQRGFHQGAPTGCFVSLPVKSLQCVGDYRPRGPKASASRISQLISLCLRDAGPLTVTMGARERVLIWGGGTVPGLCRSERRQEQPELYKEVLLRTRPDLPMASLPTTHSPSTHTSLRRGRAAFH